MNQYGGFNEHGMPRHPGMLPQNQAAEWRDTLRFWNKQYAIAQINEERPPLPPTE